MMLYIEAKQQTVFKKQTVWSPSWKYG